jgi:Ca-activated chloride channel homolog
MKITLSYRLTIALTFLIWATTVFAQGSQKLVRKGNYAFKEGKFKEAEIDYRKAISQNPNQVNGLFNLGNSLYKQNNYDEAASAYITLGKGSALKKSPATELANTFYNLGNSFIEGKKYKESIDAYKSALRINPKDEDTRYNLAYALEKLQQQQDKKDQKNKQEQKPQNKQQKQQENQKNKDQNSQINKQNAEQMLNALSNNEKRTLDKVNKKKTPAVQAVIEKDW